jgi:hypothetical protein
LEGSGQTEDQIRQRSVGGGVCGKVLKMIISLYQAKEAITSSSIYDKLELNLWKFETSSVTKNTCFAMLFPLVEFCFPKELLRAWNG